MTEKTVEQLTEELAALRKQNLEVELAAEREKVAKQQEELKKKEREALKDEIKKEMGFNSKSKLNDLGEKQSMNLTGNKELENFRAAFIRTRQKQGIPMEGKSYIEIMEGLARGEYANKGAK